MIDIGSGACLNRLKDADVLHIDMALITHAHRDQCGGLSTLIARGITIVAPLHEQPFLGKEQIRRFWNEHFPLADSNTYYSALSEGYDEVQCRLVPGDQIVWEGYRIEAFEAQGHTPGQLAYLLRRPDGDMLFCGDALHNGGKVWKGYTLDWDHWTEVGVTAACATLERFRALRPAVMAPSHGELIDQGTDEQIELALKRLQAYGTNKSFERFNAAAGGPRTSERVSAIASLTVEGMTAHQLSEHLWIQDNSYFLISATGQCLMIDCGYGYMERFVPEFLRLAGCTAVDVVIPTHAHNDHVEHLNMLKRLYGTEIWTLDLISDIVNVPRRYWHP